ncbi:hypothetical protein C922_05774 [Plasmodium inui San Antonio 1]|uniref:Uncharacterized protein n=1 Tax=Plasmodium inui San Antonio 1 TaxID=1237626 RepID=W7AEZ2_9APIC|nr:hypothetical protein C922_05774 [Plasmodium inui San Antonio 1]EUD63846.1 hypothetical protein C922_05774 [Plasmodium inui San Antonio 1]
MIDVSEAPAPLDLKAVKADLNPRKRKGATNRASPRNEEAIAKTQNQRTKSPGLVQGRANTIEKNSRAIPNLENRTLKTEP